MILQGCYPGTDGVAPTYCSLITRDPITQRVTEVMDRYANVGRDRIDGLDMTGR
jgi:hypothetical protein